MTLTDREIAILHLALVYCSGGAGPAEFECAIDINGAAFDEMVGSEHGACDRGGCDRCDADAALAMVPLYRHAFGIEAPGEGTVAVLSTGTADPRDVLEWDDETLRERSTLEWVRLESTSPASLAIANALSKMRP